MSGRFPILGAFIIVNEGCLLDAGIVELVTNNPIIYRLPPREAGELREHLGLLFTIFYLYGDTKDEIEKRKDDENFLIYPDAWEYGPRRSSDFPGLMRHIKRHYQEKPRKKLKKTVPGIIPDISCCGHEVFDRKAFKKIFKVSRKQQIDPGIVQTGGIDPGIVQAGGIDPQDMFLLDATRGDLLDIYEALRVFDRKHLEDFRLKDKEAESLIDLFRISLKTPNQSKEFGQWDATCVEQLQQIGETHKKLTPIEIRDSIDELVDAILIIDDLIVPDGWDSKAQQLKEATLKIILANLPDNKYGTKTIPHTSILLYDSLLKASTESSEAEFLLILYNFYFLDYSMAAARCLRYCRKNESSGIGWLFLGKAYLFLQQYKRSRKAFELAFRLQQEVAGAIGLAFTYRAFDEKNSVWTWINKALDTDPENYSALASKAKWMSIEGKHGEGLEVINAVLQKHDDWLPGHDIRAFCLYGLGRYDEVIDEVQIMLSSQRPPKWTRYALVASLYCKEKYKSAKEEAQKALSLTTDSQVKGLLHLILRKIAVKENVARDAVRHSIAMCRLTAERQTSFLWLAADLEWAGHHKLATSFWEVEIDYSQLGDEAGDATLLFTTSGRWEKAVKCVCLVSEPESFRMIANRVPEEKLRFLCAILVYLIEKALTNQADQQWRKPFDCIKALARITNENQTLIISHYLVVAAMSKYVNNPESVNMWLMEWDELSSYRLLPEFKCLACFCLYKHWSEGQENAIISQKIEEFGLGSVCEEIELNQPTGFNCTTVCSAIIALLEIHSSDRFNELILKFRDWISSLDPNRAPGLCRFSLEQLMYRLIRHGKLEEAAGFNQIAFDFFKRTREAELKQYLANAVALVCLASSALPDHMDIAKRSIDELDREIHIQYDRGLPEDLFILGEVNLAYAQAGLICENKNNAEPELDKLIHKTLKTLDACSNVPRKWITESVVEFLGNIAERAANISLDSLVSDIMQELEMSFGDSDAHARTLARLKRRLKEIESKRPLNCAAFISPAEELDKERMKKMNKMLLMQGIMTDVGKGKISNLNVISREIEELMGRLTL